MRKGGVRGAPNELELRAGERRSAAVAKSPRVRAVGDDDGLAARARRIARYRVADLNPVLRAASPTAKRGEAHNRRSVRRLELELGQAPRANENGGVLAPTAETGAATSSIPPPTALATMALTPLCATGALNRPGRRAFEAAAPLATPFSCNLTEVWRAAGRQRPGESYLSPLEGARRVFDSTNRSASRDSAMFCSRRPIAAVRQCSRRFGSISMRRASRFCKGGDWRPTGGRTSFDSLPALEFNQRRRAAPSHASDGVGWGRSNDFGSSGARLRLREARGPWRRRIEPTDPVTP